MTIVELLFIVLACLAAGTAIAFALRKSKPVYEIRTECITASFEIAAGATAIVVMHAASTLLRPKTLTIFAVDETLRGPRPVIVESIKIGGYEQECFPPGYDGVLTDCESRAVGWGCISGRDGDQHLALRIFNPYAEKVCGRIMVQGYPYSAPEPRNDERPLGDIEGERWVRALQRL